MRGLIHTCLIQSGKELLGPVKNVAWFGTRHVQQFGPVVLLCLYVKYIGIIL